MYSSGESRCGLRGLKHKAADGIWGLAVAAALILASPRPGRCAEGPQETDHETIQRLIQQSQELQLRVQQLEAKLNVAATALPAKVSAAAAPAETAIVQAPAPIEELQNGGVADGLKLHIFGDTGYEVSDAKGQTNSFHIGSLDLFMTANLSERVSVLGEVLFSPRSDNSFGLDVERLLLQYKHNDYFSFAAGRYHSSIGYYNTAFHQGAWFQTAVDRPFMYAFDDQGGFLPLQEVGVTTGGEVPSGKLDLHYVAEVGNGRSHLLGSDPAQNAQDTNNGKSFNLALFARPSRVPGLQAGFSIYRDRLTFSDNINHSEMVSTVHVVYRNPNWEFLNEGMLVRHGGSNTGGPGVFYTPGFYTQVSHRLGKYRPYFRYAYVNAGVNEPIYGDPTDGPAVGRRNGPTFGTRYDLNGHSAVKFQYDYLSQRGLKRENLLQTQFSFAF